VCELQKRQDALWLGTLQPELEGHGIRVRRLSDCSAAERRRLHRSFERDLGRHITVRGEAAAAGAGSPMVAIGVAATIRRPGRGHARLVEVGLRPEWPRFFSVGAGAGRLFVPLDDLVASLLPAVVGRAIVAQSPFRITRDAGVVLPPDLRDEPASDGVVRLEIAAGTPDRLVSELCAHHGIGRGSVYTTTAPLGLAGLAQLVALDRPELKERPWRPVTRPPLRGTGGAELLAEIGRRDILVHHPYDSFDTSVDAFVAAATEPGVTALKATVYRTGKPSTTLASLIGAATAGRRAVCMVELRARFDERRNLEWSRTLAAAGVEVIHGPPGTKVHAKVAMIERSEAGGTRGYVHIGTGNYHASNASAYEDLSLFTSDPAIVADVADVFDVLAGAPPPPRFRTLVVGPWFLRPRILREIDLVAAAARRGERARIRVKVNALVDPEVTDALYTASCAGADIDIVARGACVLRPQVPGLSERITVRSVLGRFLEHSRILSFEAGGRATTWIGSADLMPRNLDRRIEVLVPLTAAGHRAEVAAILDALLADTRLSWDLRPDGTWQRSLPPRGRAPVSAQELLMAAAAARAARRESSGAPLRARWRRSPRGTGVSPSPAG
jgi:polyphosphate kinase